jgi:hypothetical protein
MSVFSACRAAFWRCLGRFGLGCQYTHQIGSTTGSRTKPTRLSPRSDRYRIGTRDRRRESILPKTTGIPHSKRLRSEDAASRQVGWVRTCRIHSPRHRQRTGQYRTNNLLVRSRTVRHTSTATSSPRLVFLGLSADRRCRRAGSGRLPQWLSGEGGPREHLGRHDTSPIDAFGVGQEGMSEMSCWRIGRDAYAG